MTRRVTFQEETTYRDHTEDVFSGWTDGAITLVHWKQTLFGVRPLTILRLFSFTEKLTVLTKHLTGVSILVSFV